MTESRYSAHGIEAEFEPGSRKRVLRNRLGIVRVREMQQVESEALIAVQKWAVSYFGPSHRFTSADIRELHGRWLGGIYLWAGQYRQVNVSKGGFVFAAAAQVPRLMQVLEAEELTAYTPCRGVDDARLIAALARIHAELVLIHPFREGNGRCARLLAWLMALQAGLPPLDFSVWSGRGRQTYFAAIQTAIERDYAPLERCFSRVIVRTLRVYGRGA